MTEKKPERPTTSIRLSDVERAAIQQAAAKAQISLSQFIVGAALMRAAKELGGEDLDDDEEEEDILQLTPEEISKLVPILKKKLRTPS